MNQLVTVIIPNFNNAKYLNECLDSVINQGFDVIKEIIVVDDHSTDNSWEILNTYKTNFSQHIYIYKNPKKGAQSARNFGFTKASGKYIQWLDSDDILGKDKIRKQLDILHQLNDKNLAFCGWAHFNKQINDTRIKPRESWKDYKDSVEWLIDSWLGGEMMQTSCWLVPRELSKVTDWDEKLLKNQDGAYFFNILLNAEKLLFSTNSMVFYRIPSNKNTSQKKDRESIESVFRTYNDYHRILEIKDTKLVRKALATNYANLIAYVYPEYKDIQLNAKKEIRKLGLEKMPKIGGRKFQLLRFFFGLQIALKISKTINKKN